MLRSGTIGLVGLVVVAILAAGCDTGTKGSSSASAAAAAAPEPGRAPAGGAPVAAPAAADMPDLAALLGTQADGWNPKVFAKLKEDMTPAQAEQGLRGAGKPDQFGFADIPVTNVKGVVKYRLSFQQGKLKFGEIWFAPKLEHPAFEAAFIKAGIAKWGKHVDRKPGDEGATWFDPNIRSARLSKIIDLHATGWHVQVALK